MYPVQARRVVDISFPRHVSPCQVDCGVFYIARNVHGKLINVTCSAILALLDRDDDLRARHELLNTERIL